MSKYTYTATGSDNKVETRKTDRSYTHVVVAQYGNGYRRVEWCGRLDLAQKAYQKYAKPGIDVEVAIIPVDNPRESGEVVTTEPTAAPADVDMGGDFDGFIAEVNAGQVKPAAQVWYTDPVTSADGEQIKARIMQLDALTWIVDLFKEGVKVEGEGAKFPGRYIALNEAGAMVASYLRKLNHDRAVEMGDDTETIYENPWDYDEDEARVKKHDRIARLRRQIEQNEAAILKARRELDDLLGE